MSQHRRRSTGLLGTLAARPIVRVLALLTIAATPVSVYAAAVGGLTTFVNGTIADAGEMNANFAAVSTAVDDNHARISTLEALPDQQCASGDYATGIDASGNLLCDAPPTPTAITIVSTPLPSSWSGDPVISPLCPAGTIYFGGALGAAPGVGLCSLVGAGVNVLNAVVVQSSGSGGAQCFASIFELPSGPGVFTNSNCSCMAFCQPF